MYIYIYIYVLILFFLHDSFGSSKYSNFLTNSSFPYGLVWFGRV